MKNLKIFLVSLVVLSVLMLSFVFVSCGGDDQAIYYTIKGIEIVGLDKVVYENWDEASWANAGSTPSPATTRAFTTGMQIGLGGVGIAADEWNFKSRTLTVDNNGTARLDFEHKVEYIEGTNFVVFNGAPNDISGDVIWNTDSLENRRIVKMPDSTVDTIRDGKYKSYKPYEYPGHGENPAKIGSYTNNVPGYPEDNVTIGFNDLEKRNRNVKIKGVVTTPTNNNVTDWKGPDGDSSKGFWKKEMTDNDFTPVGSGNTKTYTVANDTTIDTIKKRVYTWTWSVIDAD